MFVMAHRNHIRVAPDGLPELRQQISVNLREDQRNRIQWIGEQCGIVADDGEVPRTEMLRLLLVIAVTPRANVETRARYALRSNLTYMLSAVGKRLASLYPTTNRRALQIGSRGVPSLVCARLGSWLHDQMRIAVAHKMAQGYPALNRALPSILDDALSDPGCDAVCARYGQMTSGLRKEILVMEQRIAREVKPMVMRALGMEEVAA